MEGKETDVNKASSSPKVVGGKDTRGPNDPIVGTRGHVPYLGGVLIGTIASVHHRKSGVVWVQYVNDTTLYEVELHLFLCSAEETNAHLLEVREKTPKPPPNKALADPEPKGNPRLTPRRTRRPPLKTTRRTTPTPTSHQTHTGTMQPQGGVTRGLKNRHNTKWVYKRFESTHEFVCRFFVHV